MIEKTRYVLDTDTCIYLLNGNQTIKDRVALVGVEMIAVTVLTKGELYFGAYNSNRVEHNLKRIEAFFAEPGPLILPLEEGAMDHFGKIKTDLKHAGRPIGDIDLLIASIVLLYLPKH